MLRNRKVAMAVGLTAAATMVMTACGSDGDCDSWDPGNTYYGWCWNMQRLFTRTLVGYSSTPGANNVAIEGDLATGLGQHNADFTEWTYKLKPNIKWEDGSVVTSKQIKY